MELGTGVDGLTAANGLTGTRTNYVCAGQTLSYRACPKGGHLRRARAWV